MGLDYDRLMTLETEEKAFRYSDRDTMLYGLSVGMGADPMDRQELDFVYEKNLKTLPTMATVLAWDNSLIHQAGINYLLVVHGEQRVTLHKPLPPEADILVKWRIKEAVDKGEGRGALIYVEKIVREKASGDLLCTNLSTVFARGDGGFGGPSEGGPKPHVLPDRAPDHVCDLTTMPSQALFYRLCGDRNPLHSDPDVAVAAGFDRPILHGLCTYGHACHAIVEAACDYDSARMTGIEARFSAPVFPGETIRTEMWEEDGGVAFRAGVPERNAVVLNNGFAPLAA